MLLAGPRAGRDFRFAGLLMSGLRDIIEPRRLLRVPLRADGCKVEQVCCRGLMYVVAAAAGCQPGARLPVHEGAHGRLGPGGRGGVLVPRTPAPGETLDPGLAGIQRGAWALGARVRRWRRGRVIQLEATSRLSHRGGRSDCAKPGEAKLRPPVPPLQPRGNRADSWTSGLRTTGTPLASGLYLDEGRLTFPQAGLEGSTVIAEDEWVQVTLTRDPLRPGAGVRRRR